VVISNVIFVSKVIAMKPIWRKPCVTDGGEADELWLGVPTWDPGNKNGQLSVKFAYRKDGRIPRTAPEVPEDVVVDMVVMLAEHGRLSPDDLNKLRGTLASSRTKGTMQSYFIFVDEMKDPSQPNSAPSYQIALRPYGDGGGSMATKQYSTKEGLIADLQQYLGYTDGAIQRLFSGPDRHQALNHPLSDEVAAYFGWLPEFNRR
jgi:hypothetical protein